MPAHVGRREAFMHGTRTKLIATLAVVAVLIGTVAGGRHLIAGSSSPTARSDAAVRPGSAPTPGNVSLGSVAAGAAQKSRAPSNRTDLAPPAATSASPKTSTGSGLPTVPVVATPAQVVHTATIALRVGKGKLNATLQAVARLAGTDGGYVDSSSLSGGTVQRSPIAGTIVIRVLDSDFADAITTVAGLGTVNDQRIKGKDVTVQIAQNGASIAVLGDEVALLEKKLAQATDINTFLQIQQQLFPVEAQLQKLQAAQAVLENSAALATVTVHLSAPGAPVAPPHSAKPNANAATMAWRYLRHNSLAVLDGLAVAGGWALPVVVLLALVGFAALRIARRRRQAVNPA
jgi:hypothetical protein